MIQYQTPQGVPGFTMDNAWEKIPFNVLNYNSVTGSSFGGGKVKVPTGVYLVDTSLFFKGDDQAVVKTRLIRADSGAVLCEGSAAVFPDSDKDTVPSKVDCVITIVGDTELELQARSAVRTAYPRPAGMGKENYATWMLDKIE